MKLLVVYGLKTRDRAWLDRFYPVRRLAETGANRSIPLRFLFSHEVPYFLTGSRPSGEPSSDIPSTSDFLPSDTVCLMRGSIADGIWLELERAGYRCVNSRKSSALALDKLKTARFLETRGWPTPKTITVGTAFAASAKPCAVEPPMACPFVIKPRFGSRGSGVELIETPEEFEAWKTTHEEPAEDGSPARQETEWIAQEYLAASRGKDLRVFFAGGEVIAAAERNGPPGDFRSNASTGGSMRAVVPTGQRMKRWFSLSLDIARESGLWYGTVDFLYRNEIDLEVCEINSSPGFEALERDLGLDIAGAIVDRLVRDFG